MVVLLTGASGFIGEHLAPALRAAGHRVISAIHLRSAAQATDSVAVDYTRDFAPEAWRARLEGVDAIVNAVGILRERGTATFDALHVRAPRALFAAAAEAKVRRVVQISALGADEDAASAYHTTKRRADDFLSSLPMSSVIVQPSLVYGRGGASAELFDTLASLPLIPLPGAGRQHIQPVHIDDLVTAVLLLLDQESWRVGRLPVVGPEPLTVSEYLATLRDAMGLGPAPMLHIPPAWVALAARAGDHFPALGLDRESLGMLERGNTASPAAIRSVLGRDPRRPAQFIGRRERSAVASRAQLNWLLPLLRLSVALLWIVTGIVSLTIYPVADSLALLARVGITGQWAPLTLAAAGSLDIALGIASLVAASRRLWWTQIVVILAYTVLITWRLPEFWWHPYGPVLKNLPLLALLLLLARLEER